MKYILYFLSSWMILVSSISNAQVGFGMGNIEIPKVQCITAEQEVSIQKYLLGNISYLEKNNKLPPVNLNFTTSLRWPLQLVSTVQDPSYYGIVYFLDQDKDAAQLLDYNCGARTYDGHNGVDIVPYPFPQLKQELGLVNIIAAAPGVIIGRVDGNPDKNCATCAPACSPNAIYIQHEDGTVAWYTHMKNGSVTSKLIGQSVALGEYLGKVGSSGNSGAPHLHFHIWRKQPLNLANWLDPFAGECNHLNGDTSFWNNQRPYRRPAINKIMTGSAAIVLPACPQLETTNEKNVFAVGEGVYVTNFFQDILSGSQSKMEILKPDGSVWQTWNHTPVNTFNTAFWWWGPWNLPGIYGYWKYRVTLLTTGQEVTQTFYYGNNPPIVSLKSGDFNDPSVWSNNTVPGAGSQLFVCHGIEVKDNRQIGALLVNENGQVVVSTGKTLQVGKVELMKPNSKMVD